MEELLQTIRPIVPFVNFALFLVVAYWAIRKPLLNSAKNKREEFLKQFEEANRIKREAADALQALEKRQQAFHLEISKIHENTEKVAQLQADQILQQAQMLSQNMIKEARATIENETLQASENLKVMLAEQLREKTLEKFNRNLSSEKHHELIKAQSQLLPTARLKN